MAIELMLGGPLPANEASRAVCCPVGTKSSGIPRQGVSKAARDNLKKMCGELEIRTCQGDDVV
jgi:hypothetical protein